MKKEHEFDFNNTISLHKENDKTKRLALETLYIYKEGFKACNFQRDTQFLNLHTKQAVRAYTYITEKKNHLSDPSTIQ